MSFVFFINIVALLFSFFVLGALFGAVFSSTFRHGLKAFLSQRRLTLIKSIHNPILIPGKSPWTAEAVMNPAAIVIDDRTHVVYRAVGMDGFSRLGYASSPDGVLFDLRLPYPIYIATNPRNVSPQFRRYSLVMYPSGGSWGGCEDPRMVLIDGRIYITFNMIDGWDFMRVAAISIAKDDFIAHHFGRWSEPRILSGLGERHKNWVLFPEKINGKFAILHSIAPNIEIAYRDSIEAVGVTEPFIKSWVGPRDHLPAREHAWDSHMRSAGPPPLKTDKGWLLFYHAIDEQDPGRYKLGAMLLDLNDPTKILSRSPVPILSPDKAYENKGKPGVVYACGVCVRNGTLFVYYGGADKVVCVATAPLNTFLRALVKGAAHPLTHQPLQTN